MSHDYFNTYLALKDVVAFGSMGVLCIKYLADGRE